MDQDAIWYGGRPRPRQHCVRWGPSSHPKGAHSQFSTHVYWAKRSPIRATAEHLLYDNMVGVDSYYTLLKINELSSCWNGRLFGHNGHGPKSGGWCAPFRGGELGPHLTQCGLGRGQPLYQVVSWSIQLLGHNGHVLKSGRGYCAPFCVSWGRSCPLPNKGHSPTPNFRPMSLVAKRLYGSRCYILQR